MHRMAAMQISCYAISCQTYQPLSLGFSIRIELIENAVSQN
jgi:hypothetical protein